MSELKISIMDGAIYRYTRKGRFGRPLVETLVDGEKWTAVNRNFCDCRFCVESERLFLRKVLNHLMEAGDGTG